MIRGTYYRKFDAPLGEIWLASDAIGLSGVWFVGESHEPTPDSNWTRDEKTDPLLNEVVIQFKEFFAGSRQIFDLPLSINGTKFQKEVWSGLDTIPYGETTSYSGYADSIGKPGLARAVASAIAKNPISIVVPCHRVIGKDKNLRGYAGGVERKKHLLQHEIEFKFS